MAALARRELEAAKLKDENITLSQEVTKLSSHVNTSLKFNARIFQEQTSSEKAMQKALREVQDLRTEKRLLERRLKEEEALRKLSEEKLKTIQENFNIRLRRLENTIKEKEQFFSEELVAIRYDHRNEIEELTAKNNKNFQPHEKEENDIAMQYKSATNKSPLKHKILDLENEIAACNNLLKRHEERHKKSGLRLKESLESLDEYRVKLNETEIEKKNMLREIKIKDKQLQKLRTDLEYSSRNLQANVNNINDEENMDDAIDFMKEEMLTMKSTYEKQIQHLKDEIEILNQQMKRR
jgi:hypothetical protein